MEIQDICQLIDERKDELFELLCSLVRINSENFASYGNEREISEYIKKLCEDLNLETEMYSPLDLKDFEKHPDYFEGRGLENRFNVTARWNGKENTDGLMLMGHSDTVRIGDPNLWSCDPLAGEVRDGKIWGRGACDDKYAIATSLFVIKLLKEQGFVPKKNILFTSYGDEEYGGSHGALAAVLRYPAERIVNMDCLNFDICHCASGGMEVKYRYHTAKAVDNAEASARAIGIVMDEMKDFTERRRRELSENEFYKKTVFPDSSFRYLHAKAGDNGADMGVGEILFVTYTDKTKEEIFAELHDLEGVIAEKLLPLGVIGDGFTPNTRFFHYVYSDPNNASIRDMQEAALLVSGRNLKVCATCLSDMSVILKYGPKETFDIGIVRSFDKYGGAHQADEFLECEEFLEYTKIIAAYVLRCMQ